MMTAISIYSKNPSKIVSGNAEPIATKGKTFWKWANGQNIYEFENEIDPRYYSDPVHVYDHYSQTYLLVYISELR